MNPYLTILRLNVCALSIIGLLVGAIVAGVLFHSLLPLALIASFVITGAGNVINDYFDVKIDRINRPTRPIPSGKVSRRQALAYYTVLSLIGLVAAAFVSVEFLAIAIFNVIVLTVYSWKLKRTALVGNVAVAYLAASNFLAAGLIIGTFGALSVAIVLFFGISFLGTVSREIVKDIEDTDGDRKMGAATLPIIAGEQKARLLANAILLLTVISLALPLVVGLFSAYYLIGAVPAVVLSLYSFTRKPARAQKLIKIAMYFVMLGFILGSVL